MKRVIRLCSFHPLLLVSSHSAVTGILTDISVNCE